MLLPDFVFHTTDGLQNGEAVLLSSNMLFKKNVSWFFCITKRKKPNCKPWCLLYHMPDLVWSPRHLPLAYKCFKVPRLIFVLTIT